AVRIRERTQTADDLVDQRIGVAWRNCAVALTTAQVEADVPDRVARKTEGTNLRPIGSPGLQPGRQLDDGAARQRSRDLSAEPCRHRGAESPEPASRHGAVLAAALAEDSVQHVGQEVDAARVRAHAENREQDDLRICWDRGKYLRECRVDLLVDVFEGVLQSVRLRRLEIGPAELREVPELVSREVGCTEGEPQQVEAFA